MNFTLVTVAAGDSIRWQGENNSEKKEFALLSNGKTVLENAVMSVYSPIAQHINTIIIVYKHGLLQSTKDALNYDNLSKELQNKFVFIKGGKTRAESTKNAIDYIKENISSTHIITHDGARPYPSEKLIKNLFILSQKHKAVIPVIPLVDTVKQIKDGHVVSTLERGLYSFVQTPQFFDSAVLIDAYNTCYNENDYDDSQTVSRYGEDVYTSEGDVANIKITYKGDI